MYYMWKEADITSSVFVGSWKELIFLLAFIQMSLGDPLERKYLHSTFFTFRSSFWKHIRLIIIILPLKTDGTEKCDRSRYIDCNAYEVVHSCLKEWAIKEINLISFAEIDKKFDCMRTQKGSQSFIYTNTSCKPAGEYSMMTLLKQKVD